MVRRSLASALALDLAITLAVGSSGPACEARHSSGDDDDELRAGDDDGDDSGDRAEFWCCLNHAYYECPDAEAVDACAGGFDLGACEAQCGPADVECMSGCVEQMNDAGFDPSSCDRDSAMDRECEGGGGGDGDSDSDADTDSDADADADSGTDCPCDCNTGLFCDPDPDFPDSECQCDNDCPGVLFCDCDSSFDTCDDDPLCGGHMCDCDPDCF
ncbi:MAG: hypothetical protein HYY06_05640 [Deltaproteobacteria bacterium]|nr:hypothetical protein [Deltaproteobacteria bacterium]